MSFERGSLSFRSFAVVGEPGVGFDRTATLAARRYSWKPINAERGERESFGWIDPRDPLNDRFAWEDLRLGDLVILAARRDVKTFSLFLWRAELEARLERVKEERGLARITRQMRLAIEEELTIAKLKETSPTTSVVEVIWDRVQGLVLLGSTSASMCERVRDLFQATFDVRLMERLPGMLASSMAGAEGLADLSAAAPSAVAEAFGALAPKWLTRLLLEEPEALKGPVVFRDPNEEESIVLQGEMAPSYPEAEAAALGGRRVFSTGLILRDGEDVWSLQLCGKTFAVSGMRVPVPTMPDRTEHLALRIQAAFYALGMIEDRFLEFVRRELAREAERQAEAEAPAARKAALAG